MSERVSDVARRILEYGLEADPSEPINIPPTFIYVAQEIYDVPEKPVGFEPNFKKEETLPGNELPGKIVLVSGGLDSTVSWLMATEKLGKYPDAYYVNMGQSYADKEKEAMEAIGIPYEEIKVEPPEHLNDGKWKHIHPGRNFYYLSLVAERATEPSELVLSAVDGEISKHGGDKSRAFFTEANRILMAQEMPVKVVTPLEKMTKTDLVAWAKENQFVGVVSKTISCFSGEEGRCGRCQSCLRTWIAFSNNGIDIPFNIHPMQGAREFVDKYKKVMGDALQANDFSHYSERRITQTLGAFDRYERK